MLHIVWFYLCEMSRKGKSIETEQGTEIVGNVEWLPMSTVSFWNDKNAQELAMMNAQSNEYAKAYCEL